MTEVLLIGGAILMYILLGKNNKNKVNDITDNTLKSSVDDITDNRLKSSVDRHFYSESSDNNSNNNDSRGHTKR